MRIWTRIHNDWKPHKKIEKTMLHYNNKRKFKYDMLTT